jgi:predicted nicotinamide N-methyase
LSRRTSRELRTAVLAVYHLPTDRIESNKGEKKSNPSNQFVATRLIHIEKEPTYVSFPHQGIIIFARMIAFAYKEHFSFEKAVLPAASKLTKE